MHSLAIQPAAFTQNRESPVPPPSAPFPANRFAVRPPTHVRVIRGRRSGNIWPGLRMERSGGEELCRGVSAESTI